MLPMIKAVPNYSVRFCELFSISSLGFIVAFKKYTE